MHTNAHESFRSIRVYSCAFVAILSGCARYSDFTLPSPDPAGLRPPFRWEASPDPVLSGGVDTLNPSVIRFQGTYLNLYSEYDGRTWHTALATSGDGVHWGKRGRVLSPQGWEGKYIAANGSAIAVDDRIFYWYQAGDPPRIALARSNDGRAWTKHPEAVVPLGPRGSFDERGVSDPYVIHVGDAFYLFYTGLDRARRQRLGIAQSTDGVHWSKLRSNPILEMGAAGAFDENGLGEPAVWSSAGVWWMLYTGRATGEQRRMGLAKSSDGVHWERESTFKPISGDRAWDREVVCDPTLEVTPTEIRVWFGGGDVPSPDQNLHGQIGLGFLRGSQ
jgi:sucrose-6-phosphate hydrolase SacC (GH32 family)